MAKSSKSKARRSTSARKAAPAKKKVAAKAPSSSASRARKDQTPAVLPFGRMNYILLVVGIAIIGFGFLLMSMDDFIDATQFSVSLYIAPFVVVAGFVEIIYAIMYKAPQQDEAPVPADS